MPDLGKTPLALRPNPPIPSEVLTQKTNQYNDLLENALDDLNLLTDISIASPDVDSLFDQLLNNPSEFGFTQVPPEACLDDLTPCENPNEYIFWDLIHPTTVAHKLIGDLALETLQAQSESVSVPEPTFSLPLGLLGLWIFRLGKKHKKAGGQAKQ